MTIENQTDSSRTLRLVWPQWQGAAPENVEALFPEVPLQQAVRGYAAGTAVLQAVLPPHSGPTAAVPVALGDDDLERRDGIDAKNTIVKQLGAALAVLNSHSYDKVLTLGGECSVSVAPFAALTAKYGDELAVVWIDSHPDVGTPQSGNHGYHAMAVTTLIGRGDPEVNAQLPATIDPSRVALAGLHSWTDDDFPNIGQWGLASFSPEALRTSSDSLLAWLRDTGCTRVAIHLDVDVVDSNEVVLGLGMEPNGLTSEQVKRLIADLSEVAEVVGLTIAEYIPRQVMEMQNLTSGLPLI